MGTKNNPGKFDCHAKAAPDEPMFVLLGRDPLASLLVSVWADVRERMGGTELEMIEEARQCALHMFEYCLALGKSERQAAALAALQEEFITDQRQALREQDVDGAVAREQLSAEHKDQAAKRVSALMNALKAVLNQHLDEHPDARELVNDFRFCALQLAVETVKNTHWNRGAAALRFAQMLGLEMVSVPLEREKKE